MRRVQQELIFGSDFEILEAVWVARRPGLVEMRPAVTDREAEIRSDALGEFAADVGLYD